MRAMFLFRLTALVLTWLPLTVAAQVQSVQLGPRPFHLVDQMADGPLKQKLAQCTGPFRKSDFSIGHRGAPLQFPEHTRESYVAAARMGAGSTRMRRDLHQGSRARLPSRAMRPAHDHEHPCDRRVRGEVLAAIQSGRPRVGQEGGREVLHERPHPRRVPPAPRQNGCRECRRHDGRAVHGRHSALAHRPLRARTARCSRTRKASSCSARSARNSRPSSSHPRCRCLSAVTTPRKSTRSR